MNPFLDSCADGEVIQKKEPHDKNPMLFSSVKVLKRWSLGDKIDRVSRGKEYYSTPHKPIKPDANAFHSTGFLSKKPRSDFMPTPQTPSKKSRSKFVPLLSTPFGMNRKEKSEKEEKDMDISFLSGDSVMKMTTGSSRNTSPLGSSSSPTRPPLTYDTLMSGDENSSDSEMEDCNMMNVFSSDLVYRITNWKTPFPHFLDAEYFRSEDTQKLESNTMMFTEEQNNYFDSCFEVLSVIGSGSFSDVYRVRSKADGNLYAVKRSKTVFTGEKDRKRNLLEVENLWRVAGLPNCLQIVQAWEQHGVLYIQTELCDTNLKFIIEETSYNGNRFTESQIWDLLFGAGLGLSYIHSQEVVHLDIKPANILCSGMDLKIGDFGLSRKSLDSRESDFEGDKYYIAPEVLSGEQGKPSDVYSLGLILLELAADIELPAQGEQWQNLRQGKLDDIHLDFVSDELSYMIKAMLHPDPVQRPTIEQILNHSHQLR